MLLDYQISNVNVARFVLASQWERPAAHDGKQMEGVVGGGAGVLGKVGSV